MTYLNLPICPSVPNAIRQDIVIVLKPHKSEHETPRVQELISAFEAIPKKHYEAIVSPTVYEGRRFIHIDFNSMECNETISALTAEYADEIELYILRFAETEKNAIFVGIFTPDGKFTESEIAGPVLRYLNDDIHDTTLVDALKKYRTEPIEAVKIIKYIHPLNQTK